MTIRRFVKVKADLSVLPFSLDQIKELLLKHFGYDTEIDVNSSAWSPNHSIYLVGTRFPSYFDLQTYPEVLLTLNSDNTLNIQSNFDVNKDYNAGPQCECGVHVTHGKEYKWHSYYCPLFSNDK